MNIGAVLGLLPITGVPLPLVSYGGSALLPTMFALGMLLAFARSEAGAVKTDDGSANDKRRSRTTAKAGKRAGSSRSQAVRGRNR